MKILYGIQGTGNGHISRGHYIYKLLYKYSKEIDVLISGNNYSLTPSFPIKYQNTGITFSIINGKIDYLKTLGNFDLYKSYVEQKKIPFQEYDLIITDFEPISAWGAIRYKIPSIHISHQASFLDPSVPRPKFKNLLGEYVMKYFCPTNEYIGLHYKQYGKNISEPIILDHIKLCKTQIQDHITIYLPWYEDDYLYDFFKGFNDLKFHVFSKKNKVKKEIDNCIFFPINQLLFVESLKNCYGVICNTGFQTTSEVLYLGKRLLTIPVKGQYEQICNSVALKKMGVSSLETIDYKSKDQIKTWLDGDVVRVNFQNNLSDLLNRKIKKLFK